MAETKTCSVCKEEKEIAEYYKSSRNKDGKQFACKSCSNKQNVASMNKKQDKYKLIREKAYKKALKRFQDWKRGIGCSFCDENEPICLELHHKDPNTKEIQPNRLRARKWETFMSEASKCIVVCSNCHKKVHAGLLDDSDIPTIGESAP